MTSEADILRDAADRLGLIAAWVQYDKPRASELIEVLVREVAIVTVDVTAARRGTHMRQQPQER